MTLIASLTSNERGYKSFFKQELSKQAWKTVMPGMALIDRQNGAPNIEGNVGENSDEG